MRGGRTCREWLCESCRCFGHKVAPADVFFYLLLAHLAGGWWASLSRWVLLGKGIIDPAVGYSVTIPCAPGVGVAFPAEEVISFGLMVVVLGT